MLNENFILEDSLSYLKTLSDESVDCVITSPPYNLGIKYNSYSDSLNLEDYLKWLELYAIEIARILKPQGHLFLNVGYTNKEPWVSMDVGNRFRRHLILQNNIIWCKHIKINLDTFGIYKPITSDRYSSPTWENIFHFTKTGNNLINSKSISGEYGDRKGKYAKAYTKDSQEKVHLYTCSRSVCKKLYGHKNWKSLPKDDSLFKEELQKYMNAKPFVYNKTKDEGNVWYIPYTPIAKLSKEMNETGLTNKEGKGSHPATFPVDLPERCLKFANYNSEWVVVDPFCGTGTTAVACKKLGIVKTINIDIDSEYLNFAKKRYEIAH